MVLWFINNLCYISDSWRSCWWNTTYDQCCSKRVSSFGIWVLGSHWCSLQLASLCISSPAKKEPGNCQSISCTLHQLLYELKLGCSDTQFHSVHTAGQLRSHQGIGGKIQSWWLADALEDDGWRTPEMARWCQESFQGQGIFFIFLHVIYVTMKKFRTIPSWLSHLSKIQWWSTWQGWHNY